MTGIGSEANKVEKAYTTLLALWPKVKRRLGGYVDRFGTILLLRKAVTATTQAEEPDKQANNIEPGDTVRVRSYAQIKATLNSAGYCRGLKFQNNMRKYCQGIYKVTKKPEHLLDECGK